MARIDRVDVIIPALNEAESIGLVLRAIDDPRVRHVVVVDNGSTDATAAIAHQCGATVVEEPMRGYGSACLAGIAWVSKDPPDALVFLDADFSDHPEELPLLLAQIDAGADLVVGSRTTGGAAPGALLPQARFGNWLSTRLVRLLYGVEFTDLGPFRVITWSALRMIGMQDVDFGWTVEMQVKAAKHGVPCAEVPVRYRERIGVSKITGTVNGTIRAGHKILWTIFRERYLE